MAKTSAIPAGLYAYGQSGLQMDGDLDAVASRLGAALDTVQRTCPDVMPSPQRVDQDLHSLANDERTVDTRMIETAKAFERAGGQGGLLGGILLAVGAEIDEINAQLGQGGAFGAPVETDDSIIDSELADDPRYDAIAADLKEQLDKAEEQGLFMSADEVNNLVYTLSFLDAFDRKPGFARHFLSTYGPDDLVKLCKFLKAVDDANGWDTLASVQKVIDKGASDPAFLDSLSSDEAMAWIKALHEIDDATGSDHVQAFDTELASLMQEGVWDTARIQGLVDAMDKDHDGAAQLVRFGVFPKDFLLALSRLDGVYRQVPPGKGSSRPWAYADALGKALLGAMGRNSEAAADFMDSNPKLLSANWGDDEAGAAFRQMIHTVAIDDRNRDPQAAARVALDVLTAAGRGNFPEPNNDVATDVARAYIDDIATGAWDPGGIDQSFVDGTHLRLSGADEEALIKFLLADDKRGADFLKAANDWTAKQQGGSWTTAIGQFWGTVLKADKDRIEESKEMRDQMIDALGSLVLLLPGEGVVADAEKDELKTALTSLAKKGGPDSYDDFKKLVVRTIQQTVAQAALLRPGSAVPPPPASIMVGHTGRMVPVADMSDSQRAAYDDWFRQASPKFQQDLDDSELNLVVNAL